MRNDSLLPDVQWALPHISREQMSSYSISSLKLSQLYFRVYYVFDKHVTQFPNGR